MNGKQVIEKILKREDPGRFAYAPNYWQWITHRVNHDNLPEELRDCPGQLELIQSEGLDVFSRNIYSSPYEYWFGGLSRRIFEGVEVQRHEEKQGEDTLTTVRYIMKGGELEERFRYIHSESTLVQDKFLVSNPATQLGLLEEFLEKTRWEFDEQAFQDIHERCGDDGIPVAGEFFSPLKMFHLYMGPVESTFVLSDRAETAERLMGIHERNHLDLVGQMAEKGVPALMAMDNLDSMFHPPYYVEEYSASFYERASALCHKHGSHFFIHACGQQKANLKLISDLGVDGLEGVAYPPLGDVSLDEAMEMTGKDFIITGGISAAETTGFKTRDEVYSYLEELLGRMKPYRKRFILSASCNTAIETDWSILKTFHQAWRDLGC